MTETNPGGGAKIKHGELTADGKRLEYFSIPGPAEKPTIVMLHEGLGCIAMWKRFPQKLAEATGCGIFAYSRYGYGKSEVLREKRTVDYLNREAEVVLPAVLDQMGIKRPILFGHSDGGTISLIFAGKYPERPRAMIVEAPHVFLEDFGLASIAKTKIQFETTDLPQRFARYHADPASTFHGWSDIWLDPQFRHWNIEQGLQHITCPILLIQGEEDEYGSIAQLEAIRKQTPLTEILMLPDCGHTPHREQEAKVLAATVRFLNASL